MYIFLLNVLNLLICLIKKTKLLHYFSSIRQTIRQPQSLEVIFGTKSIYFSNNNYIRLYLRLYSRCPRRIHVELSLPETRRSIGYENERHRCGKSARG